MVTGEAGIDAGRLVFVDEMGTNTSLAPLYALFRTGIGRGPLRFGRSTLSRSGSVLQASACPLFRGLALGAPAYRWCCCHDVGRMHGPPRGEPLPHLPNSLRNGSQNLGSFLQVHPSSIHSVTLRLPGIYPASTCRLDHRHHLRQEHP